MTARAGFTLGTHAMAAMYGFSRTEAEKLIDDYAHELAGVIRWETMRDDAAADPDPRSST